MGGFGARKLFRLTGVQLVSDELVRADKGPAAAVAVDATDDGNEGRCLSAFDARLSFIGQYGGETGWECASQVDHTSMLVRIAGAMHA